MYFQKGKGLQLCARESFKKQNWTFGESNWQEISWTWEQVLLEAHMSNPNTKEALGLKDSACSLFKL